MTATVESPPTDRETWKDWLPEGYPEIPSENLFTREQISASLKETMNVDVSPDDFRYWERIGVIPRGVRKWHDGAIRSVYPYWFLGIVYQLRTLQAKGYSLEKIRPRLRAMTRVLTGENTGEVAEGLRRHLSEWKMPAPGAKWSSETADLWLDPYWDRIWGPEDVGIHVGLARQLEKMGERIQEIAGVPMTTVRFTFVDADGVEYPYELPIPYQVERRPTE